MVGGEWLPVTCCLVPRAFNAECPRVIGLQLTKGPGNWSLVTGTCPLLIHYCRIFAARQRNPALNCTLLGH